jgi:hypothetical protein
LLRGVVELAGLLHLRVLCRKPGQLLSRLANLAKLCSLTKLRGIE